MPEKVSPLRSIAEAFVLRVIPLPVALTVTLPGAVVELDVGPVGELDVEPLPELVPEDNAEPPFPAHAADGSASAPTSSMSTA